MIQKSSFCCASSSSFLPFDPSKRHISNFMHQLLGFILRKRTEALATNFFSFGEKVIVVPIHWTLCNQCWTLFCLKKPFSCPKSKTKNKALKEIQEINNWNQKKIMRSRKSRSFPYCAQYSFKFWVCILVEIPLSQKQKW